MQLKSEINHLHLKNMQYFLILTTITTTKKTHYFLK